ncbi:MAG: tol-pal system protein YbgF [Gammaproteobacteria bacterium]|nr:MAG: tol-pal system protein YbgF [Gammaproteobacteria bacterium]
MMNRKLVVCLLVLTMMMGGFAEAADRLLDRRTSSGGGAPTPAPSVRSTSPDALVELLVQMDVLQNEVRDLRNQVEIQSHELQRLKQQQKTLLQDVDQRIGKLEGRGGSASGSVATVPTAAPTRPVTTAQGRKAYEAAFALMKQGAYDKAIKAFREFLLKHPKSRYAGNAQYWIAEAHYYQRKLKQALADFNKVLADYPDSPKVPDAMLKIGFTYFEMEDWAKARQSLEQVVQRYPNTRTAKSAQQRLQKLQKAGR